jgi:crotonobetainyl-CoA:carnitine CoA-transferase CaiB-like acyl-CoA transferase
LRSAPRLGRERLAIACFDDAEWQALARHAGHPEWLADARFATLESRLAHQDELDAAVGAWTAGQDAYQAMFALQAAGVPAGVSQTAADRYDRDPQLAELEWLTEVTGTKIGRWPVIEVPTKMTRTPPYAGGPIDRGAPGYGEDNERILMEMLGMSQDEVRRLAEDGII